MQNQIEDLVQKLKGIAVMVNYLHLIIFYEYYNK